MLDCSRVRHEPRARHHCKPTQPHPPATSPRSSWISRPAGGHTGHGRSSSPSTPRQEAACPKVRYRGAPPWDQGGCLPTHTALLPGTANNSSLLRSEPGLKPCSITPSPHPSYTHLPAFVHTPSSPSPHQDEHLQLPDALAAVLAPHAAEVLVLHRHTAPQRRVQRGAWRVGWERKVTVHGVRESRERWYCGAWRVDWWQSPNPHSMFRA